MEPSTKMTRILDIDTKDFSLKIKFTGSDEFFYDLIKKLDLDDDGYYYYSESTQSKILISEMNINHLENAFYKLYREWIDLAKEESRKYGYHVEFFDFRNLVNPKRYTMMSMLAQLKERYNFDKLE